MQHITLVTKKLPLAIRLSEAFNEAGYFVNTVNQTSEVATVMLQKNAVGLLWDLSSFSFVDSQTLLSQLRRHHQLPILALAKDGSSAVDAFHADLDDYVIMPGNDAELIARFQQKQRLYQQISPISHSKISQQKPNYLIGEVLIDQQKYKVFKKQKDLGLTPKELKLLVYLIERSPQVLSRQQLLEGVWGDVYDVSQTSRMVDIHISHLRDKIEVDPKHPQYLKTVRGFGYHFVGEYQKEA